MVNTQVLFDNNYEDSTDFIIQPNGSFRLQKWPNNYKISETLTLKNHTSYHRILWNNYDCNMIGKIDKNLESVYNMSLFSQLKIFMRQMQKKWAQTWRSGSEKRHHHKYVFSILQQEFRNKLLYTFDFINSMEDLKKTVVLRTCCSKCLWNHIIMFYLLQVLLHLQWGYVLIRPPYVENIINRNYI